jgi:hypothetical protein
MPQIFNLQYSIFNSGLSGLGLNLRGLKTKEAALERISEYASSHQNNEGRAGRSA